MKADPRRLDRLTRFGYPGPLAHATSLKTCFPNVFSDERGYWAYVIQRTPPGLPDVVFFAGDPICAPARLDAFVEAAVDRLSRTGRVAALQVHKPAALALERLKDHKFIAHQLGAETQIRLPYELTGQIGNKVRQALREGLIVEEMAWPEDDRAGDDGQAETITVCETMSLEDELRGASIATRIIDNHRWLEGDLRSCQILSTSPLQLPHLESDPIAPALTFAEDGRLEAFESLLMRLRQLSRQDDVTSALDRFGVLLHQARMGNVDPTCIPFVKCPEFENLTTVIGDSVTQLGYYERTAEQHHECRYEKTAIIIQRQRTTSRERTYRVLLPGTSVATEETWEEIAEVSRDWLQGQHNPTEMGPPLLKPFSREYQARRRLFVARSRDGSIVGFVDFDPVHRLDPETGAVDLPKSGYYANMIRTKTGEGSHGDSGNAGYLILAAAAQRFAREGCGLLNLGLNPLGLISAERRASDKGSAETTGLTPIENVLRWVSRHRVTNATTYPYQGVIGTKQRNWRDDRREEVMTYVVLDGTLGWQIHDVVAGFNAAGATGPHIVLNMLGYLAGKLRGRGDTAYLQNDRFIALRRRALEPLSALWNLLYPPVRS